MGFADAVIESLMGFLFTVGSVLRCPFGVHVEDIDAGIEHWEEPVLREVWVQRHCMGHFHTVFYRKEDCGEVRFPPPVQDRWYPRSLS